MTTQTDLWARLTRLGASGPRPTLIHCADPMCSWCWGFAPIIDAIARDYAGRLAIEVLVGGLRAGNRAPTDAAARTEILGHWQAVQARTGQRFTPHGALPDGFVYDTEPPCRAVVSARAIRADAALALLAALQRAFYVEQQDITQPAVLTRLAGACGVDPDEFGAALASQEMRARTRKHFRLVRELGVRGFPSALLADAQSAQWLSAGYRDYAELAPAIDAWLVQR
jgi:putative protein-disulfide isomerase